MVRFTASEARRQISRLLDAAERGEEVIVERKGARFRISLDTSGSGKGLEVAQAAPSPLLIEDEAILSGQWTWVSDQDGKLQFQARDPES